MARRVSPSERLRAQIDGLFASERDLTSVLEDVARLSVRLMMQTAVEAEVDEFLGRARYERRDDEDRPGSRNGWQPPATVKTTMGPVELQRPKLRDTDEAFCSRLFGAGVTRTNALESLVISGWVRGLSDRDIEAALAEVLGREAALSKSTVSRICQRIRDEFDAWKTRDLSGVRLDYLFLDGSHFRMHAGAPAEPVLAAWGIDTDGRPVFVGLAPAASESTDAWDDFLADLTDRGLRPPLLGISDGGAGLIAAFELRFATSLRQRCLVHRARNVLAKVSAHDQAEVKADFWTIFDVGDTEPGDAAVAVATRQAAEFAAKWQPRYPAAVACVTDDLASLTMHLRFPAEHWRRIRHSNFIAKAIGSGSGDWNLLRADLLKVSHHGSKHGVSLELVERVAPWCTIVSSTGGWGQYGFPHQVTQDIIREALEPTTSGQHRSTDAELRLFYTADSITDGTIGGSIGVVLRGRRRHVWRFGDAATDPVDLTAGRRWAP